MTLPRGGGAVSVMSTDPLGERAEHHQIDGDDPDAGEGDLKFKEQE